ncbi:MAG: permease-like cell division protein FtsX [Prevotella sp.]|nr:permease-like cell division protein FtsX [Prevotella sp.]
MGKNKNKTRSRQGGLQVITLCISTAMVLILLGIVVLTVLSARNLSASVKEKLPVFIDLGQDLTETEAKQFCDNLSSKKYINSLKYISKEQVLEETKKTLGTDPTEFAGMNPFLPSLQFQLHADYANTDSLKWISEELTKLPNVTDVRYPEDLIQQVNSMVKKFSLLLLVIAALLLIVCFVLINNTVKLSIYARRFNIHTMKLVGASWSFIRGPFIKQAVAQGLVAGILANAVLGVGMYLLWQNQRDVMEVITWKVLVITGVAVLLFGVIITTFCSWLSVNNFLKMKAGELYKI